MAVLVGSIGGIIVGLVTEYYTGGPPIRKIAQDGETGPATVMISGLATGMQSVAIPVITIVLIIFISNIFAGLYGVGIAAGEGRGGRRRQSGRSSDATGNCNTEQASRR